MLAHVSGFPVEEFAPLAGTGGFLLARALLSAWIRDSMGR
jgi:hypothetical protein